MVWAPDSTDLWAPDSGHPDLWASDSKGRLILGRAVELFLAAKAAEGASPRTIEWYRMILVRLVRAIGSERAVDGLDPAELRAWLVELRTTLAPVSVAGYVRTLRVLGNWLAAEGLAEAAALRGLRRPRVPHKVIEPVADDVLRRLLAICSIRDRAILLLMIDTGARVSEVAGLRLGDLRPDGTLKIWGKGSKERIVPVGSTARQAIVRYIGQRGPGTPDDALFLGRRGEISARGLQHMVRRIKARVGVTGRLSPHSLRHTFARSYLVNGGDVFSLQRILGHTTLDMVKRYVALADIDLVTRHAAASPADRLAGDARRQHVGARPDVTV